MKPAIPFWLIGMAVVAVVNSSRPTQSTCCCTQSECHDDAKVNERDASEGGIAKSRESLGKLQAYVGQWRGVGQPKRGSTKDSWVEKSDWAWNFAPGDVALKFSSQDAKFFRTAELRPATKPGDYELTAKSESGAETKYTGTLTADGLALTAAKSIEGLPSRISIRLVAGGDRMVVLYERQSDGDRFTRLAEVGSTRQGSGFGKGTSYVECVVTGGLGTIPVMHLGKTYYVCCTGCRDYFNDNPEEVLAEYRARKDAKK